jgi:hypothetical protein
MPPGDRSAVQPKACRQFLDHALDGACPVDVERLKAIVGGIAGDLGCEDAVAFQQIRESPIGICCTHPEGILRHDAA